MEQKLISPQESLPNEGEIVYLILYEEKDKVRNEFFVSIFYDAKFLSGSRRIISFEQVYRGSPTERYYNPFKEARNEIQTIINKDEDDNNTII